MRKTTFSLILFTLASTLAISVVSAGSVRYKWRDTEGNLHYSDSLPADANSLGYDVVNAQGILIKRVAPAMSADQLVAAKAEAATARSAEAEAERQSREDQQLLAANPTEADLLSAQSQQIEMIELNVKGLQTALQSLERTLTDLLGRAAEQEREGKPVSAKLASQIADIRSKIDAQHKQLSRQETDKQKTTQGFSAELEHYRALRERYKQH
ncbi:MAG: DUF4124 domain-containing protein [Dokdonella sp.]